MDEWDFDSDGFVPYLDRAITLLTRLIGEVEQFESRMKILNCLSLVVERMDSLVNFVNRMSFKIIFLQNL